MSNYIKWKIKKNKITTYTNITRPSSSKLIRFSELFKTSIA